MQSESHPAYVICTYFEISEIQEFTNFGSRNIGRLKEHQLGDSEHWSVHLEQNMSNFSFASSCLIMLNKMK